MEGDVEAQRGDATQQQSPTPRSPMSPFGRLSWNSRSASQRSQKRRQSEREKSATMSTTNARDSNLTPTSPAGPSGATIFNTQDKPELKMMESYAVHRSFSEGIPNFKRDSMSNNRALLKSPTLLSQRSRSQKRSSTLQQQAKRSSSKRRSQTGITIDTTSAQPITQDGQVESPTQVSATTEEDTPAVRLMNSADTPSTSIRPLRQKLSEFHARHPDLMTMPMPLLPIVSFPGQGTGNMSEFEQKAPIWSKQPYKILYFIYFGLSVGLVFLPWFAFVSLFPSQRARPSWTWKKSTLVKLYRHGARLTFRTYTSLSRDLTKEVPHSKTVRAKFVWVDGLPDELVRGEMKRMLAIQGLSTVRTCGFWYGERDGGGGVGQKAAPGEKLIYHLHGGAYWIGTAHENDVTSAVNMQLLKALNKIYSERIPSKKEDGTVADSRPSPHPPSGGPGRGSGEVCKRAFSLDYRLCVPGRPEIGSFPAPLADAVAGYRYLVNECEFEPENIIVAGDSAGGNLALSLCRYLRDEKLGKNLRVPGALILLSPWADVSRSHAGPLVAPNKFSSVWLNAKTDIIANSVAFRNTAVSALIGKMPARETYRNPYLSSISLQLDAKDGGAGPSYGFEGFPKRVYICTGTAELSYDQHLTLAFRLAAGSKLGKPLFYNDKCSQNADPYEMAARLQYPRPDDHEVTIWPSAQNTPVLEQIQQDEAQQQQQGGTTAGLLQQTTSTRDTAMESLKPVLEGMNSRLKMAEFYGSSKLFPGKGGEEEKARDGERVDENSPVEEREEMTTTVKEKDTAAGVQNTHKEAERKDRESSLSSSSTPSENQISQLSPRSANTENTTPKTPISEQLEKVQQQKAKNNNIQSLSTPASQMAFESATHSQSYFDIGQEDRIVILDECIDAIHDYTLFDWFEPQRGDTWSRIAKWVDEDV